MRRAAGYHGVRSQRRYSAFYEWHGRKGSSTVRDRGLHDGMAGRHKKCSIWFRVLKYTVLSARSDRATGPPVRGSKYVWIIALSMPKFASRQDRPDTAVSSYIHSACLR